MKSRSPLLGYNHNFRYNGRLYHVQTEDSGIQNPHIFTHLFHGGTILATKRSEYNAEDADDAVQRVMQTQHKTMLKELRDGAYDERISLFFKEPLPPRPTPPPAESGADRKTEPSLPSTVPVPDALEHGATSPSLDLSAYIEATHAASSAAPAPASIHDAPTGPVAPPAPVTKEFRAARVPPPPALPAAVRPASQPVPTPSPVSGRASQYRWSARPTPYQDAPSAEGVVVARPAVIVGDHQPNSPPPVYGARLTPRPSPRPTPLPKGMPTPQPAPAGNIFGETPAAEKSLDDVILAYLSEDMDK